MAEAIEATLRAAIEDMLEVVVQAVVEDMLQVVVEALVEAASTEVSRQCRRFLQGCRSRHRIPT